MKRILFILLLTFFTLPVVADAAVVNKTNTDRLKSGLIGYWTFDGANITNGRINDVSGQGNHGTTVTIASSTFYKPGKIGQAGNFDGVDDVVTAGTASSLHVNVVTVTAWVRPKTVTAIKDIIKKYNGSCDYWLLNNANGTVSFYTGNTGSNNAATSNTVMVANQWYFLTGVHDGTNTKIYINGIFETNAVAPATPVENGIMKFGEGFTSARYYDGILDDVRIYNRALSAAEIATLYTMGTPSTASKTADKQPASGLVGLWSFDGADMTNGRVNDLSGNANHGNLVSIATTTFFKPGRIGQGFNFDGVNDYVNLGAAPSFSTDTVGTISAWIKPSSLLSANGVRTLFAFGGNSASSAGVVQVGLRRLDSEASGVMRVDVTARSNGDTANGVMGSTNISPGVWYHVVFVSTGSAWQMYVNGTLETLSVWSGSNNGLWFGNTTVTAPKLFTLGTSNSNGAIAGHSNGSVDDVRIFSKALTAAEVTTLYTQGTPSTANKSQPTRINSGLVAHWTFDGPDMHTNVADKTGRGNNGFMTGFTSTSTAVTFGKIGQGLKFDGVNDYVSVPYAGLDFERTDPHSISMWVKVNDTYAAGGGHGFFGRYSGTYGEALVLCDQAVSQVCNAKSIYFFGQQTGNGNHIAVSTATNSFVPYFGKWTHITGTYDGSSAPTGMKIYINGVSQSLTIKSSDAQTTSWKVASPWRIGDDYTSDYVPGSIDDVRIYNRVLSATEVSSLYNLGR